MGASIVAYIEYDDLPVYLPPGEFQSAFVQASDRVIDLSTNVGFTDAKDYLFIGALGGPRNPRGLEPLFQPRGLPPNVNWRISQEFSPPDTWTGWLLLSEIEAALAHMHLIESELAFGTQIALGIMRLLVDRLGDDRVRLVFDMSM
jgi:hypothetical protein